MMKLTATQGGLLLLFSLALAAGQLLFKLGANQGEAARSLAGALELAASLPPTVERLAETVECAREAHETRLLSAEHPGALANACSLLPRRVERALLLLPFRDGHR